MNDALRAAVFARDKAICSFSGLSVWYLDHGASPFSQADWVDHVRPRSKNGLDTLDNLVCASHFYNRKKLNNVSDKQYLFSNGRPTDDFFWTHGELTRQQANLLERHAALEQSDWYFNRAIYNIMVAIGDELAKVDVVRTRDYWLTSAGKRMAAWRRLTGGDVSNFQLRNLVRFPDADDVQLMLELGSASYDKWTPIYEKLKRLVRSNESVFRRFLNAKSKSSRLEIVHEAEAAGKATLPLISVLKRNSITMI